MKAKVVYIVLSLLLLSGGNVLFASTQQSTKSFSLAQKFEKKQLLKHKNSNHHGSLNVSADADLDEEFHNNDDLNEIGATKVLANNQKGLSTWYLVFSNLFVFKDNSITTKSVESFIDFSNPIYLKIGVLRI
jgi:hypothetical protein